MKNLILLVLIVLSINFAKAQDIASIRNSTIKGFVSTAFKDKKQAGFIIDHYMYLLPNDTISRATRERIIAAMRDSIITSKGKILCSSSYKVVNYDDFKGNKKKFNTDDNKDILILSVKNEPVIYFYFKEDRIMSFYCISKGDLSFFVII